MSDKDVIIHLLKKLDDTDPLVANTLFLLRIISTINALQTEVDLSSDELKEFINQKGIVVPFPGTLTQMVIACIRYARAIDDGLESFEHKIAIAKKALEWYASYDFTDGGIAALALAEMEHEDV